MHGSRQDDGKEDDRFQVALSGIQDVLGAVTTDRELRAGDDVGGIGAMLRSF
jgi:hypothetical protein